WRDCRCGQRSVSVPGGKICRSNVPLQYCKTIGYFYNFVFKEEQFLWYESLSPFGTTIELYNWYKCSQKK
ncbi:hypothetical protein L9F63_022949, partial [Diploptera punctata]